jgi:hypothetical protein
VTRSPDYGIVRFTLDGVKENQVHDCYSPRASTELLDLGLFDLTEGKKKFVVEITGANSKSIKRHMFGLDYLLLERQ